MEMCLWTWEFNGDLFRYLNILKILTTTCEFSLLLSTAILKPRKLRQREVKRFAQVQSGNNDRIIETGNIPPPWCYYVNQPAFSASPNAGCQRWTPDHQAPILRRGALIMSVSGTQVWVGAHTVLSSYIKEMIQCRNRIYVSSLVLFEILMAKTKRM